MADRHLMPVQVQHLLVSNVGFVVLLKGDADPRSLPIFIGAAEAQSIAIHLNQVEVPRPLTHDLLKCVLDFLECRLLRVNIPRLEEGTFYASLVLERDGQVMDLDARPSDAIALALRAGAPLFVADSVMEEAGRVFRDEDVQAEEDTGDEHPEHDIDRPRKPASQLDLLKARLARAIARERYEDAARLRDEINELEHKPSDN